MARKRKPIIVGGARRVTIYQDRSGEWRYKVQGGNWRTIETSEEGFSRKSTAERRIANKYPGVEVVYA